MSPADVLDLTPHACRKWAAWHDWHAAVLDERAKDDERSGYRGEAAETAHASAVEHRRFAAVLRACAETMEETT